MIIYKATCLKNNKVYVGQTIDPLNERKSNHISRSKPNHNQKKDYFHLALTKHGRESFTWEEIDKANSVEELDKLEIFWIAFYKAQDKKFGYNLAEGGRVNRGFKKTKEQREKLSIALKGRKTWNKGVPMSDTLKQKLIEINSKPVICKETGRVFQSSYDAARELGGHGENIAAAAKGKIDISCGFHWEYVDKELSKNVIHKIPKQKRSVLCIETNQIYPSIGIAAKKTNSDISGISLACRGLQKSCGGFRWKFADK